MKLRIALSLVALALLVVFWISHDRGVQRTEPSSAFQNDTWKKASPSDVPVSLTGVEGASARESTQGSLDEAATGEEPSKTATLHVVVADARTREPVPDVRVIASPARESEATKRLPNDGSAMGSTDEHGVVVLEVPSDECLLVVTDGSAMKTSGSLVDVPPMATGETRTISIAIDRGRDLVMWLNIVDEETRAPLVESRVCPVVGGQDTRHADALGRVSIDIRSGRQTAFRVDAPGHGFAYVLSQIGHETPNDAVVIELGRSASVRARLTDTSGSPIAGANVSLCAVGSFLKPAGVVAERRMTLPKAQWRVQTDANGLAMFADVSTGAVIDMAIQEWPAWRLPKALTLKPGEVRDVDCRVGAGAVVEGRMVDQFGQPVARRSVRFERADGKSLTYFRPFRNESARYTTTDDEGRFVFRYVDAGDWRIGPDARRRPDEDTLADDVAPVAQFVHVPDDVERWSVDMRVDRGLNIRGRVLDPLGQPARNATIRVVPETDLPLPTANVSSDGTFSIGPIVDGRYELRASSLGEDAPSEPVIAGTGGPDVILRLRAGSALVGRVVDASSQGVTAQVVIARVDGGKRVWAGRANDDGAFVARRLEPGEFSVVATTPDGRVGLLTNTRSDAGANNTMAVVRVEPAGKVRVEYAGTLSRTRISIIADGVTVDTQGVEPAGTCELIAPLGSVLLRMSHPGSRSAIERSIEVHQGSAERIVLRDDS